LTFGAGPPSHFAFFAHSVLAASIPLALALVETFPRFLILALMLLGQTRQEVSVALLLHPMLKRSNFDRRSH